MILFTIFIGLWIGLNAKKSWIVLTILFLLFSLFIYKRFKKKCLLCFVFSFLFGVVLSLISVKTNSNQYVGFVTQSRGNYYLLSNGLQRIYVANFDNTFEVGDFLMIKGNPYDYDFPALESSFDFNEYLRNKGVTHGFDVTNCKVFFRNPIRFNQLKQNFLSHFSVETRNFIGSIYFGSGYQSELSSVLADLHLYRISTLSGFSIFAILHIIKNLLSLKINEKKAEIISYIILIPYFIFSIEKFAVFKIVFMFIFKLVNDRFFNNKIDYISRLSILGIFCLCFDHYLAYQWGFNLSFLMTIILHFFNNSFAYLKASKKKVFSLIFIVLFFIPFELNFYHEISITSPLFQVILSPYLVLVSICTMLCFYHLPIYGFVDALVMGLSKVVTFIKPLFASIYAPTFPLWFALIYELILLGSTYIFSIRFKPLYKTPLILGLVLCVYFVPIKPWTCEYIAFLNIGQGDSTFIHAHGLNILVDTGGNLHKDLARECLIPFFKKNQIYYLDYLITTHDDFDHIGARDSLLENFRVKNYYNEIDQFPINDRNFVMENLNIYSTDSEDENENSLVLKFMIKDTRILIMGDAPICIENQIINDHPDLRCDILKVGHHGSNTSSCLRFVQTVDPNIAIISCGKKNKYGHPHPEVLSVLKYLDIEVRRTDVESTIIYKF